MSKANYTYNPCGNSISSNCVTWVGPEIPCLNICKNDRLTDVESAIALKLCELVGDVDMSTVTIPDCLKSAWSTKDKNILNLIQVLLDQACVLQTEVDSINQQIDSIDPNVTVDWKCMSSNPCVTITNVTLSVALQNIINYVCNLQAQVTSLETSILGMQSEIDGINSSITNTLNPLSQDYYSNKVTVSNMLSKQSCKIDAIIAALLANNIVVSNNC